MDSWRPRGVGCIFQKMISSHASMAVDGSIPSARGCYDLSQRRAFGTLHEGDNLGLLVRAIAIGQLKTIDLWRHHVGEQKRSKIAPTGYAIPRRLNTGTLARSAMNAKATAATSIPPTRSIGRRVIAIPEIASVEAISRSTTDDATSHGLGRQDPRR